MLREFVLRNGRNNTGYYRRKWDVEDREDKVFVGMYGRNRLGKYQKVDPKSAESVFDSVLVGRSAILLLPDGDFVKTSIVHEVDVLAGGRVVIHTRSRKYYC